MSGEAIRVVVVDDHPIVRDGLVALLTALDGVEVVGSAVDGVEAVDVVRTACPDVVVMDIQMPRLDGIEATRRIVEEHDGVRVVLLTMNEDDETIRVALRSGASGYLLKGADATEVTRAIATAASGGMVFGAALTERLPDVLSGRRSAPAFPELTDREREVLDLMAAGRSNHDIAAAVFLSPKTVRNLVSAIYAKLGVTDRAEAIIRAREEGLGRRD